MLLSIESIIRRVSIELKRKYIRAHSQSRPSSLACRKMPDLRPINDSNKNKWSIIVRNRLVNLFEEELHRRTTLMKAMTCASTFIAIMRIIAITYPPSNMFRICIASPVSIFSLVDLSIGCEPVHKTSAMRSLECEFVCVFVFVVSFYLPWFVSSARAGRTCTETVQTSDGHTYVNVYVENIEHNQTTMRTTQPPMAGIRLNIRLFTAASNVKYCTS